MTTAKPQSLSLYFDAAAAADAGLPNVYMVDERAVLATKVTSQNDRTLGVRQVGIIAFKGAAKSLLAANGHLTSAGKLHCELWGIEQTHSALVSHTWCADQVRNSLYNGPHIPSQTLQSRYDGYTPPSRIRPFSTSGNQLVAV